MNRLPSCGLIKLPSFQDDRGSLAFIQQPVLPFEIRRVYYLYDVPLGESRGAHGHRALEQLMIAVSGSFDVQLDDGISKNRFHLSRPDMGLYIPPMTWRDINEFSRGAVCLVLASEQYDEADYFRNYDDFLSAVRT